MENDLVMSLVGYFNNYRDKQWYLGWNASDTYVQSKVDLNMDNTQITQSPSRIEIPLTFLDDSKGTYYFDSKQWNIPDSGDSNAYLYPCTDYGINGRTGMLTTDPNWASGNNEYEKQQKANTKKQDLIKVYINMSPNVQEEVLKKLSILYNSNKD